MLRATSDSSHQAIQQRRRAARTPAAIAALLALAAGLTAPASVTAGTAQHETVLLSRAAGAAGSKGNAPSSAPAVSADGSSVAFFSMATNLHPDDTDTDNDVFLRKLESHETILVSRAAGAAGANGNGSSTAPAVSADGRHVAFDSFSTNLHPDDADGVQDIYLRDLATDDTILVSRATGAAGATGNGASTDPSVSADGRYVAFHSIATNLHPVDTDSTFDVYVRDLVSGETILVSRAAGANGAKGNGPSSFAAISGDGRRVAFTSTATNLHPDDVDTLSDVYVRDLQTGATLLVSRATGAAGAKGNSLSQDAAISADGLTVAFDSFASNLSGLDGDAFLDVYVRELDSDRTLLVSRAAGTLGLTGNGHSVFPVVSAHGRYVAFHTLATNLHPDDPDSVLDVLVRDLATLQTTLASRAGGAAGVKGDGDSFTPSISRDGRRVVFESFADNLHPDDPDVLRDVLLRDVLGPPLFADGFESGDASAWSLSVE